MIPVNRARSLRPVDDLFCFDAVRNCDAAGFVGFSGTEVDSWVLIVGEGGVFDRVVFGVYTAEARRMDIRRPSFGSIILSALRAPSIDIPATLVIWELDRRKNPDIPRLILGSLEDVGLLC